MIHYFFLKVMFLACIGSSLSILAFLPISIYLMTVLLVSWVSWRIISKVSVYCIDKPTRGSAILDTLLTNNDRNIGNLKST